ncbi:alpha/beta fold hydrolase [Ornithinimicrobium tianjinense]|uniref:Epoxide hydrolase EphF n=1 Tax=Ornithinimicrobium tianjinense TaxID=1195761 RepID=A0A917BUR2_9MICO|nr:alpha/beta hydrolase [Ornithinimicrobium tianjinense]GGF57038.1 putative epoxide hydrolase EphF [Ornithinimicrobium tianjinense]
MTESLPEETSPVDASHWDPPMPDAPGFVHTVVETPGLRTHVASIGGGTPVLALHGFPEHWWQWRGVARTIAAQGYQVICPDLRGAGWTVADDPRFDREIWLRDQLALLDALGIERAHVVSHDYGSVAAMQLTYAHPERVRTHVQLAVPPFFMTPQLGLAPGFRHMPKFVWHRPGTSMAYLFSDAYLAHPLSEAEIAAYLAPMSRPEIDGALRPTMRRLILPEAAGMATGAYRRQRLTVPTLAVFGREDYPWSEKLLRRACRNAERHADHFELAFVDDAKHYITDDQPDAVARLALDWFDRAG